MRKVPRSHHWNAFLFLLHGRCRRHVLHSVVSVCSSPIFRKFFVSIVEFFRFSGFDFVGPVSDVFFIVQFSDLIFISFSIFWMFRFCSPHNFHSFSLLVLALLIQFLLCLSVFLISQFFGIFDLLFTSQFPPCCLWSISRHSVSAPVFRRLGFRFRWRY